MRHNIESIRVLLRQRLDSCDIHDYVSFLLHPRFMSTVSFRLPPQRFDRLMNYGGLRYQGDLRVREHHSDRCAPHEEFYSVMKEQVSSLVRKHCTLNALTRHFGPSMVLLVLLTPLFIEEESSDWQAVALPAGLVVLGTTKVREMIQKASEEKERLDTRDKCTTPHFLSFSLGETSDTDHTTLVPNPGIADVVPGFDFPLSFPERKRRPLPLGDVLEAHDFTDGTEVGPVVLFDFCLKDDENSMPQSTTPPTGTLQWPFKPFAIPSPPAVQEGSPVDQPIPYGMVTSFKDYVEIRACADAQGTPIKDLCQYMELIPQVLAGDFPPNQTFHLYLKGIGTVQCKPLPAPRHSLNPERAHVQRNKAASIHITQLTRMLQDLPFAAGQVYSVLNFGEVDMSFADNNLSDEVNGYCLAYAAALEQLIVKGGMRHFFDHKQQMFAPIMQSSKLNLKEWALKVLSALHHDELTRTSRGNTTNTSNSIISYLLRLSGGLAYVQANLPCGAPTHSPTNPPGLRRIGAGFSFGGCARGNGDASSSTTDVSATANTTTDDSPAANTTTVATTLHLVPNSNRPSHMLARYVFIVPPTEMATFRKKAKGGDSQGNLSPQCALTCNH